MIRARNRLAVVSLVVMLSVGGCATMQVAKGSPTRVLEDKKPEEIVVRRVDGKRVYLYKPVIRQDTIWGATQYGYGGADGAVALSDVSAVYTRQLSGGGTVAGVMVGLGILQAALLVWVLTHTWLSHPL